MRRLSRILTSPRPLRGAIISLLRRLVRVLQDIPGLLWYLVLLRGLGLLRRGLRRRVLLRLHLRKVSLRSSVVVGLLLVPLGLEVRLLALGALGQLLLLTSPIFGNRSRPLTRSKLAVVWPSLHQPGGPDM